MRDLIIVDLRIKEKIVSPNKNEHRITIDNFKNLNILDALEIITKKYEPPKKNGRKRKD